MREETAMDKIVEAMAEHICDKLCRSRWETKDQEQLDDICDGCGMEQHLCNILNEYNNRTGELERAHMAGQKMAGELLREKDKHQWIPVEERLPEWGKRVWITVQYPAYLHTMQSYWADGEFFHQNGKSIKYPVLAWKPYIRPEPYRPTALAEAGAPAGEYADNPTLAPGA